MLRPATEKRRRHPDTSSPPRGVTRPAVLPLGRQRGVRHAGGVGVVIGVCGGGRGYMGLAFGSHSVRRRGSSIGAMGGSWRPE